jgi:hypothetical protein
MKTVQMTNKSKRTVWVFIAFTLLSFYSLGAGFLESFVNYPSWHIIGKSEVWVPYHKSLHATILPVLAIQALLLQLIANVLMFFYRPSGVPRSAIWLCLITLLIIILSSAFIQIPMQVKLDDGYTTEMVDDLIFSDFWLRTLMGVLRCAIVVYLIYQVVSNSENKSKIARL